MSNCTVEVLLITFKLTILCLVYSSLIQDHRAVLLYHAVQVSGCLCQNEAFLLAATQLVHFTLSTFTH